MNTKVIKKFFVFEKKGGFMLKRPLPLQNFGHPPLNFQFTITYDINQYIQNYDNYLNHHRNIPGCKVRNV